MGEIGILDASPPSLIDSGPHPNSFEKISECQSPLKRRPVVFPSRPGKPAQVRGGNFGGIDPPNAVELCCVMLSLKPRSTGGLQFLVNIH